MSRYFGYLIRPGSRHAHLPASAGVGPSSPVRSCSPSERASAPVNRISHNMRQVPPWRRTARPTTTPTRRVPRAIGIVVTVASSRLLGPAPDFPRRDATGRECPGGFDVTNRERQRGSSAVRGHDMPLLGQPLLGWCTVPRTTIGHGSRDVGNGAHAPADRNTVVRLW